MPCDNDSSGQATSASCLEKRIRLNSSLQPIDFNAWVFSRVVTVGVKSVLELCCGTGMQTEMLASRISKGGKVYALDVSGDALASMKARTATIENAEVVPVQGELDDLETVLSRFAKGKAFDLCFCSYGLYYARDFEKLWRVVEGSVEECGAVAIVGPYGDNNSELFDVVSRAGVSLSHAVIYSSKDFMESDVIRMMVRCFESVTIDTMSNAVIFKNKDDVMAYWESTTFYDKDCRKCVEDILNAHFEKNELFVNHKHVMCAVARKRKEKKDEF